MEEGDCGYVLLFAVNQENSPEGAYKKHKEFMKTQEEMGALG